MDSTIQNLRTLKDIKAIMERSSRFISLSGFSGISAGLCALIGAIVAWFRIRHYYGEPASAAPCLSCLRNELLGIGALVFIFAFVTAILFTYIKSKKDGVAIWGISARRLMWNTLLPMVVGAFLLLRLLQLEHFELIAPGSLIFYGLALVNGSKYTMGEVRYLGYAEIIIGIVNLWLYHSGLVCWAIGFGVFHIIYGVAMWWRHDRIKESKYSEA
jgi:hypothetical protein